MTSTVLGIDLGKRWFHVVGRDQAGRITVRNKFNRAQLIQFIVNHPARQERSSGIMDFLKP